jgi:hypothetical protein
MQFVLPTAFHDRYIEAHCMVFSMEPGEVADIQFLPPTEEVPGLRAAVFEQHGDQIIEALWEV